VNIATKTDFTNLGPILNIGTKTGLWSFCNKFVVITPKLMKFDTFIAKTIKFYFLKLYESNQNNK